MTALLHYKTLVLAIAHCLVISKGAQAAESLKTQQIPLLGETVFTEGIAYSRTHRKFYVSSAVGGSIQEIGSDGKAKWLHSPGTDGRHKALGVKTDDVRNRLWVVGNDAVYVYNLRSGKLIKKNELSAIGDFAGSFLNEVVLDEDGSGYITDSFRPNVFKVDGESLEMQHFAKLEGVPYGTINGSPWNANGIVLTPDKKNLLIAKTNDGSLWKLEISSKKLSQLRLSEPVSFADGLTWGVDGRLYIIRNFKNQIASIDFRPDAKVQLVEHLSVPKSAFKIPTTAVFLGGDDPQLVVVNAQFEQVPSAFFLTRVHLSRLRK